MITFEQRRVVRRSELRWLRAIIGCVILLTVDPFPHLEMQALPLLMLIGVRLALVENGRLRTVQDDSSRWATPVDRWASRPGRTGLEASHGW